VGSKLFAGRYRLVEKLGAGGMSEVWAADDLELDRRVALKLLAPQADTERFRREARAVAALAHPNVNQLYDYGEAEGRPYMVLECLTAGSLDDRLNRGNPLPDDETRRIAADIAAGLAHAHERGLVHLKPANVLFDSEGRATIADFGIARFGDAGTLTEAGAVIGTATTISPEQAAGQAGTPASDVYSFGVLLFWMLTGRPPFLSDRPLELLQLHRGSDPPQIESLRAGAPPDLSRLAAAALAKDPAARPPDGAALVRALAAPEADTTVALPAARRRRRRPPKAVLAGLVVAALAAAGAGLAIALVRGGSGSSQTPTTTPSLTLPKVSTAAASTPAPPAPTTTEATTSTTAPTTTRTPTTTARPVTTAPAPVPTLDTTVDLTTTDATTALPPPTSPPVPGTTTVGSGP
jgi:eukaryotic-like serine/threonine-protein kinase